MKNKWQCIFAWLINNPFLATMLYCWLTLGWVGAHRVAVFYIWLVFIVSLCMLNKEVRIHAAKSPALPSWLYWLDGIFDGAIVVALVWNGHALLGVIYTIHAILLSGVHVERKRLADEAAHA